MTRISKYGLICSLGWIIFCIVWVVPIAFNSSWDIFHLGNAHLIVNIAIYLMLFFGILLAPILLIIGLFKSHNNYTTSKQLRPFALYTCHCYLLSNVLVSGAGSGALRKRCAVSPCPTRPACYAKLPISRSCFDKDLRPGKS